MRHNPRPKVLISCLTCGNEVFVWQSRIDIGKGKYCSTRCGKIGSINPSWKGGYRVAGGYRFIHAPNHPRSTDKGYVREHVHVMEQSLGRLLGISEVVHHRNGNRLDNRIENLQLCASQSEHMKIHRQVFSNRWGSTNPVNSILSSLERVANYYE